MKFPIFGETTDGPNHGFDIYYQFWLFIKNTKNIKEHVHSSPVDLHKRSYGRYLIVVQAMSRWSNWFNEIRCVLPNVLYPGTKYRNLGKLEYFTHHH